MIYSSASSDSVLLNSRSYASRLLVRQEDVSVFVSLGQVVLQ